MNDNAKKWVEALRSGEFKQARNVLYNGTGYCCLGVACKLYADVQGSGDAFEYDAILGVYKSFDSTYVLPDTVMDWLGLRTQDGRYDEDLLDSGVDLAAKNDHGATFAEIADIIEREPEGLFV